MGLTAQPLLRTSEMQAPLRQHTPHELGLLALVADGQRNAEIGGHLSIGRTVRVPVRRALARLGSVANAGSRAPLMMVHSHGAGTPASPPRSVVTTTRGSPAHTASEVRVRAKVGQCAASLARRGRQPRVTVPTGLTRWRPGPG
jgi:DNA-binding CsgD family transcriptional regulator